MKDWHTEFVTLSETRGLTERFFALLRMTRPKGQSVKCTNVLWSDLACAQAQQMYNRLRDAGSRHNLRIH